MSETIQHKRGDTFRYTSVIPDESQIDNTWSAISQLRDHYGKLVSDFETTWLDTKTIQVMLLDTSSWIETAPNEPCLMDIQFESASGEIVSTNPNTIVRVTKDVSRGA